MLYVTCCIMDYGPRALEIEPGIVTAYYWIIIAADETGNSTAREKFRGSDPEGI